MRVSKYSYKNKRWIDFKERIVAIDNDACVRCGKSRKDGAILQVHHKCYIKGKALWEYHEDDLETLCKGCHAEEHGIIRPRIGWDHAYTNDLEDLVGECEVCHTNIRYEYLITHPTWEDMVVGTNCCDNLTGTLIASEHHKFEERLKRFYKSNRWVSDDTNLFIRQKRIDVTIFPVADKYKIKMGTAEGKETYCSIRDAQRKIFEFIENGEADKFFSSKDYKKREE